MKLQILYMLQWHKEAPEMKTSDIAELLKL